MKTLPISNLSDRQLIERIYNRLVALEKIVDDRPLKITSDWITPEEIEEEYGYKPRTINEWRRKNKLRKYRSRADGKRFEYSRKELEQSLRLKIA